MIGVRNERGLGASPIDSPKPLGWEMGSRARLLFGR
jgi:hypothetical protein